MLARAEFVRRRWLGVVAVLLAVCAADAQKKKNDPFAGYDRSAKATLLHPAIVYVAADGDAQHVAMVNPGHEVVVVERSGPWMRVFANTDTPDQKSDDDTPEFGADEAAMPASGWIRDKGVVTAATPGGDTILFGAAANFEDAAAQPHAPKIAAEAAHLLYRRVAEYFPTSSRAAEAAYRSADIRWQLDKADNSTLPSAKEQDAYLRPQIYEGEMKKVMKLYPDTKFAAMAAFALLDNKLCGDWQGLPKCPEMEANLYRQYAQKYPESPKAAEAMYDAVYRQGVLVSMYQVDGERKRADAAAANTRALADELARKYPASDYAARGQSVAYRVQQQIAVYGNDRD